MEKPRPFNGRVIFDHLPKTGGQAVNAWLTNMLGTGTVTTNLIGEHRARVPDRSHRLFAGLPVAGDGCS